MTNDAELLLSRAAALLDSPDKAAAGNSARLAAFLARQAVEELIDTRCATLCDFPVVVGTTKAKLAVIKSLDTTPAGGTLIDAWHQLTGFCHQHAYQLAPTVEEVRVQCAAVQGACLSGATESSGTGCAGCGKADDGHV
ncbi:hypothetical protein [Mycolicibacter heraklionensis]|uniref:hypothetical protein n=1 Tax=Mycolicibacter heraklionensis TaxID=512402 RepID=UPI0007EA8805|nr:hypothetical protein [Mycolicibacter heraklionensis]OBG34928.1 hypothetical protein A5671_03755 [Mycolicibacter heraklionensis]